VLNFDRPALQTLSISGRRFVSKGSFMTSLVCGFGPAN
jgi:hypothetical protein